MEQKVLRTGALVLAGALILRLLSGSGFAMISDESTISKLTSWMLFWETGRFIRPETISFYEDPPEQSTDFAETPQDTAPPPQLSTPALTIPVFSETDADNLAINCSFSYEANIANLLTQPLSWDLTVDEPTVLILHSHATESFSPTESYAETTEYHTLDTNHNMISIGAHVAQKLEAAGIGVLQDTALHDEPSYDDAYSNSRQSVQQYLKDYPSIRLVLDLHRDSYTDAEGNQLVRTVFSQGETLAQLMLVVGTDESGNFHPQWQQNLALALKLQTQLETLCPGICRSINLRSQRFNQDLSTGALLVEVGACGNTHQQALAAADVLAEAVISLAKGSS